MGEYETEEYIRTQRVQVMQFKGWNVNLNEIMAWLDSLGAGCRPEIDSNYIYVVNDTMSYHLKPGNWVVSSGRYEMEFYEFLGEEFKKAEKEEPKTCQMPTDYSDRRPCGNLASYVYTLQHGVETYRCQYHMAMSITKSALTNNELSTIKNI